MMSPPNYKGRSRRLEAATLGSLLFLPCLARSVAGKGPLLFRAASYPPQSQPNVILITVDTLRADRLGCYGNGDHLTPTMDALASDSILFRRAIAQVPLTLPSHTAILTGTYPMWNRIQDLSNAGLSADIPTLAEIFKRRGYVTAAFVSSFVLDSMWGLNRGFDLYDDWFKAEGDSKGRRQALERPAAETIDHCLRWLESGRSRPFFLWLHLYDPHAPYNPPEPFKSRYRVSPYDGEVAYADEQLARLVSSLKSRGLYSTSLILLTSDHGEGLGEHQEQQHGFFIYNSTVDVPLLLRLPGGSVRHVHSVSQVVNSVDIAPTLVQYCRFPPSDSAGFQGKSLLSLVSGVVSSSTRPGYSESLYPRSSFGWHSLRGLETERYHYIDAPREELYDLQQDPGERLNILGEKAAVASALRENLRKLVARYERPSDKKKQREYWDAEAAEKLRSLGYIRLDRQAPPQQDDPQAADPKDEIDFYNQIMHATELAEDGDPRQSNALLAQAESTHPNLGLVPYLEAENFLALGQPREAMSYYTRALELNPAAEQAAMGLGHAAHLAGQNTDAVKAYQWALRLNPRNFIVRLALARAYRELNRLQEAADEEREVLRTHPHFGQAQADYGITLAHLKKYDEALPALQRAITLGYDDATTYNFLGNAYLGVGRDEDAIRSYEKAIGEDPKDATGYINLAAIYAKLGDTEKSQQNLQKGCSLSPKACRQTSKRP